MQAKSEYRKRDETEVAVLDVLADHNSDGMTIFEIRTETDLDIDTLEDALANLKENSLIDVSTEDERTVINVKDHVIGPEDSDDDEPDIFDELRRRLSL